MDRETDSDNSGDEDILKDSRMYDNMLSYIFHSILAVTCVLYILVWADAKNSKCMHEFEAMARYIAR
jgi:hypothetical protein